MSEESKRIHDLAIAAAAISTYQNFDHEVTGHTPSEKRASFADYLQEEYEYFLNYYQSKKSQNFQKS